MKIVNIILVSFIMCLFSACITNFIAFDADVNMKKVALGMTKDEVIRIMGNKYMIAAASKDGKENQVEVLGYKNAYSEEYKLKFINGKLAEWNREHIYDCAPNEHTTSTPSTATSN